MELENTTPTAEEINQANVPRMSLQPLHINLSTDMDENRGPRDTEAETVFDFEAESTADAARESQKLSNSPHHHVAVAAAVMTVFIFGGTLLAVSVLR